MTYKPGTRVKKVRGRNNIGATGIVVDFEEAKRDLDGLLFPQSNLAVRHDTAWINFRGQKQPAGKVSFSAADEWEPIIPEGHRPCEDGFVLPIEDAMTKLNTDLKLLAAKLRRLAEMMK